MRYQSGKLPTDRTYTGQRSYASDFGLMYYNARWYDSNLAHFAQADNIDVKVGDTQSLDRFGYVSYNPVRYNDPSGHCLLGCVGDAILIGAAIGGVISTASYYLATTATGGDVTAGGLAGAFVGGAIGGAVSVVAAPIAASLIAGVAGSAAVTSTSLAVGGALVNAAGGALAYGVGGATINAVDTMQGKAPSFEPSLGGAAGAAALSGVLAYGAGKAFPMSMDAGQKSLTAAYHSLPGRTLRNAFTKPQAIAQTSQVGWTSAIGTAIGTGVSSLYPPKLYCD